MPRRRLAVVPFLTLAAAPGLATGAPTLEEVVVTGPPLRATPRPPPER